MNILISPVGSAGDVHPMVGLGLELQRRGHQVTMAVCGYFEDLVRRVGLEFIELGTKEEFLASTEHPDLWHPTRGFPYIFRTGVLPSMPLQFAIIEEHTRKHDSIVLGSCLGFGARIAQEKLGVPLLTVHLQPAVMWSEYDSPVLPKMLIPPGAPRWMKRFQYWLGETFVIDRQVLPGTNAYRQELGLPPIKHVTRWWHSPDGVIGLFPEWYGAVQPDWPANISLTHFPLWDERGVTELPSDVDNFLAEGDSPIVFTPGSAMRFGQSFFAEAAAACQLLNRRGILLSRFAEQIPQSLPAGVRHFEYVPFSQVLGRCAAMVHHGGIGTTAQGLAAGIPQLIMPLAHDQPDNARRLARLGVGDSIAPKKFRASAVAAKLNRLIGSERTIQACREIAGRFEGRSGLAEAADVVERFAASRRATDAAGETSAAEAVRARTH